MTVSDGQSARNHRTSRIVVPDAIVPISGACSWTGSQLATARDWIWEPDWASLSEGGPNATSFFKALGHELERGPGVCLLRGFPIDGEPDWVREQYLSFARHLGLPVRQNQSDSPLRDIRDNGGTRVESPARLNWHNDRADRVGLLTLGQAAQGGLSRIVSAARIHDEMLKCRPDLLELLYQPFFRSAVGDEIGSSPTVYELPVFMRRGLHFSADLSRTYIEQAQMVAGVPKLTSNQTEALDLIFDLAEKYCHEHEMKPGDIQFLNNHVAFHGRTAYRDDPTSGQCRHLLRVWLALDAGQSRRSEPGAHWSLPERGLA